MCTSEHSWYYYTSQFEFCPIWESQNRISGSKLCFLQCSTVDPCQSVDPWLNPQTPIDLVAKAHCFGECPRPSILLCCNNPKVLLTLYQDPVLMLTSLFQATHFFLSCVSTFLATSTFVMKPKGFVFQTFFRI